MILSSLVSVSAQQADSFKQPYPLGVELSPNPNFSGQVWLAWLEPVTDEEYLNATTETDKR
ncbi:MAG: hypothetical protein ACRC3Z_05655 [Phocaeicola sp.]